MRIAGNTLGHGGLAAKAHYRPTRGALLLNFSADPEAGALKGRKPTAPGGEEDNDPADVATIFALAMPY